MECPQCKSHLVCPICHPMRADISVSAPEAKFAVATKLTNGQVLGDNAQVNQTFISIGLKIDERLSQFLPENDPLLINFREGIRSFWRASDALREWKELHHRLSATGQALNLFNQTAIIPFLPPRYFDKKQRSRNYQLSLTNWDPIPTWKVVQASVYKLSDWAKAIRFIGTPLIISQEQTQGELWVLELLAFSSEFQSYVDSYCNTIEVNELEKLVVHLYKRTREFYSVVDRYLDFADSQLRETAGQLDENFRYVFQGLA